MLRKKEDEILQRFIEDTNNTCGEFNCINCPLNIVGSVRARKLVADITHTKIQSGNPYGDHSCSGVILHEYYTPAQFVSINKCLQLIAKVLLNRMNKAEIQIELMNILL